jgi:Amt family ammonium transporter
LLIQLYGVAVTLVWSGGVTYVLVSAFVALWVSREHGWTAWAVHSTARLQ